MQSLYVDVLSVCHKPVLKTHLHYNSVTMLIKMLLQCIFPKEHYVMHVTKTKDAHTLVVG